MNLRIALGRLFPWSRIARMGQLTEWAKQYKAGDITFEDLTELVVNADLKPFAFDTDKPDDPFDRMRHVSDNMFADDSDTMYELYSLAARKHLSEDELTALVRAHAEAHRQPLA